IASNPYRRSARLGRRLAATACVALAAAGAAAVPAGAAMQPAPSLGDGLLQLPSSVAAEPGGEVYAGDRAGVRVEAFGAGGDVLAGWGAADDVAPSGVAVAPDGEVWVA